MDLIRSISYGQGCHSSWKIWKIDSFEENSLEELDFCFLSLLYNPKYNRDISMIRRKGVLKTFSPTPSISIFFYFSRTECGPSNLNCQKYWLMTKKSPKLFRSLIWSPESRGCLSNVTMASSKDLSHVRWKIFFIRTRKFQPKLSVLLISPTRVCLDFVPNLLFL